MLSAVPSPSKPPSRLATTTELIEEIRRGHIVVLVDDEDRENEGDLIFAADFVTPEKDQLPCEKRARPDLHADHGRARGATAVDADDGQQPNGARDQLHGCDRGC